MPLGLVPPEMAWGDFFPIFPWLFVFLAGAFLGRYVKEGRFPPFLYKTHIRALAFVGRHSLLIYLAHQPLLFGILTLIASARR